MARTPDQQKSLNDLITAGVDSGDHEMLRLSLEKGGNPDLYITQASTKGSLSEHPEALLLLALKKGADPNLLLFAAISRQSLSVAKIAVEKGGADVNCAHTVPGASSSYPAGTWSYKNFNEDVSDYLIGKGMNVDMPAADGTTPLLYAVQEKDVARTMHYLRHGANPFVANKKGEFALRKAQDVQYEYRSEFYERKAEIVRAMLKNVPDDAQEPASPAFNGVATSKDVSVSHPLELKKTNDNPPPSKPAKGFEL